MKLFLQYLKGHKRTALMLIVFCMVFAVGFLLYHLPIGAVLYPTLLCVSIGAVACIYDFLRIKGQHEALQRIQTITDAMTASFPIAETVQDSDYQQIIRSFSKEHNAYRRETSRKYTDMVEYYTVWAHQIKTPIASMRLHLQNEDSALSRKLGSDLFRIEQYADIQLRIPRMH